MDNEQSQYCILYTRVSTDRQGLSLTGQDERVRAYLALKGLVTHPALTIADEAQSGRIPMFERRSGQAAWQILNHGWLHPDTGELIQVQHICCAKVDRLARNTRHALELYDWFAQNHRTLHIADCMGESFSTQGPLGKMFFTFQAMFAEYEVEIIRDRIQKVLDDKFHRGEAIGPTPFGWRDEPTGECRLRHGESRPVLRRVPEPAELSLVLQMLVWTGARLDSEAQQKVREKLASGHVPAAGEPWQDPGWGPGRIATRLNHLGYATKHGVREMKTSLRRDEQRTTSGQWSENAVARVLAGKHTRHWLLHGEMGHALA